MTVTAEDEDGNEVDLTNADIQWFAGNEEIDGADDDTLVVGDELIGLQIFVEVTDAEGKVYESEATAPVYASLALLDADQTGKSVVTLTTNGPVTALDDIDVFKGTKEVEIDSIDYEDDGAVVTLKNAIVADAEYTVTLTPADEDDEATSATFTGEKAKLDRIEFLNDVLVMKDTTYKEGYAYAKGYDQFDDEVLLSGLTVTPGVGQFKSYDNATGKITLVDNTAGTTGAFMLIKEVPVFVQYQSGNDIISAQQTLTVSTQAYVNELVFGDIEKDGTKRADERLTLDELGSGKYYVEIEDVKDQYGNTLDADDLNDQKDGNNKTNNKTLFVIPSDSGAFYQTGQFATLNGKTILWLEPVVGGGKPGTMALTITGAGGKTFTKNITVEDNPYIDVLNVTYPELYAGQEESDELEFSAVDQYGEEVDLWTFKPSIVGNVLTFKDFNNLTQMRTTIKPGGYVTFNSVISDAGKKDFKVTLNASNTNVAAKQIVTFTEQTAGMKVTTKSITIGERGTAAKIKSALKSDANTQLVAATRGTATDINFNKFIQFEDANGNEMIRGKSEKYPAYIAINNKTVEESLPDSNSAEWKNGKYVWSLTKEKVKDSNGAANNGTTYDKGDYTNGVVTIGNFGTNPTLDVYATIYLENTAKNTYYKLDEKTFHLTSVQGKRDVSYTAKAKNTIYCNKSNPKNNTEIEVTAKTDSGETYVVAKDRVRVTPQAPFSVDDATRYIVSGADASGSGTTTATVYVQGYENQALKYDDSGNKKYEEETTVSITYSDAAPTPTKVVKKFNIVGGNTGANGNEVSLVGKEFDGSFDVDSFKLTGTALSLEKGVLTMTDANSVKDQLTFAIADQYGNNMDGTTFYIDGVKVTDTINAIDTANKDTTIEWANGAVTGKIVLENGSATNAKLTYIPSYDKSITVGSSATLVDAAARANANGTTTITLAKDVDLGDDLVIASGVKVVANGYQLDAGTHKVTIDGKGTLEIPAGSLLSTGTGAFENKANGTVIINGSWEAAATPIKNDGLVKGSGHATLNGSIITTTTTGVTNNGEWKITGDTLVLKGVTFDTASPLLGGHVEFTGTNTFTVQPILENEAVVDVKQVTQTVTFLIQAKASVEIITDNGPVALTSDATTDTATAVVDTTGTNVTGTDTKVTEDSSVFNGYAPRIMVAADADLIGSTATTYYAGKGTFANLCASWDGSKITESTIDVDWAKKVVDFNVTVDANVKELDEKTGWGGTNAYYLGFIVPTKLGSASEQIVKVYDKDGNVQVTGTLDQGYFDAVPWNANTLPGYYKAELKPTSGTWSGWTFNYIINTDGTATPLKATTEG